MASMVKTSVSWDHDSDATMTAREVLVAYLPVYYFGLACSNDIGLCGSGMPTYNAGRELLRQLIGLVYQDYPIDWVMDVLLDCGADLPDDKHLQEVWRYQKDDWR